MNENTNISLQNTFSAWSEILVRQLQKRVITTGIVDWTKIRPAIAGQVSLFDSIRFVQQSGSELVQKGLLSYNVGGVFTELGVGGNYFKGNSGRVDKVNKQRNAKNWNSNLFYASIMRLGELAKEKTAENATNTIVARFEKLNKK